YDGRMNGSFDVTGRVPRAPAPRRGARVEPTPLGATVALDAAGTLHESDLLGGRLPEMAYEAHLDRGALKGRAKGRFENFNPGRRGGREEVDGRVTGSLDATLEMTDVTAALTPDSVAADGTVTLEPSTIGGLDIESATVQGRYASETGDIAKLEV